jgi:hypothetical protein
MEKIYILRKHKVIRGPYTFEKIKERGLRYNDMIWYDGLSDWTPVDQLEIFIGHINKSESGLGLSSSIFDKVFGFLK